MPINRVKQEVNQRLYFITPTIKNWYYLFDRHNRWEILSNSIIYCQKNKGLEVYSYVFMLNHIHMIISSPNISGFLRDFKRYTSQKLKENIIKTEPNILKLFKDQEGNYSFWKEDNQPKLIETEKFALQKINYIHNNPVMKSYVEKPEHWKYSSANENSIIKLKNI